MYATICLFFFFHLLHPWANSDLRVTPCVYMRICAAPPPPQACQELIAFDVTAFGFRGMLFLKSATSLFLAQWKPVRTVISKSGSLHIKGFSEEFLSVFYVVTRLCLELNFSLSGGFPSSGSPSSLPVGLIQFSASLDWGQGRILGCMCVHVCVSVGQRGNKRGRGVSEMENYFCSVMQVCVKTHFTVVESKKYSVIFDCDLHSLISRILLIHQANVTRGQKQIISCMFIKAEVLNNKSQRFMCWTISWLRASVGLSFQYL